MLIKLLKITSTGSNESRILKVKLREPTDPIEFIAGNTKVYVMPTFISEE